MAGRLSASRLRVFCVLLVIASMPACARRQPPKRYPIQGQILAVNPAKQELTINHADIPGLMPGMTMSYPVASPDLLTGRTPGELVTGVLEVDDATGRLVEIAHTGSAPLPEGANAISLSSGVLGVGDAIPDAAFIDQDNRRRAISDWIGTPFVLTFIYTRCPLPTFCPLMSQNFATLQRRLSDDTALRGHVKLISISFDPDYDTPPVLAAYAAKLKANPAVWTFLTGDRATVERFAGKLGVSVMRAADETSLTHNLRTFLVGADGRLAQIYSGSDWTPETVLGDLRRIAGS
jgi:protein SCO1/2